MAGPSIHGIRSMHLLETNGTVVNQTGYNELSRYLPNKSQRGRFHPPHSEVCRDLVDKSRMGWSETVIQQKESDDGNRQAYEHIACSRIIRLNLGERSR